jgi:ferrous iron transport protein B
MKVALMGNPNSGKTTLFNAITGRIEQVGNWAGVTIEKKEGEIRKSLNKTNTSIIAVDLPGAYSMSPFTSEENITRDFVKNENPDVIINIVDATNLSRSLFFTTQILELGIPVVIALNKSDLNKKKETVINVKALSQRIGCPVVETISTGRKNNGLQELIAAVAEVKGRKQSAPFDSSDVNMADKSAVEASDRKRFEFVKSIVSEVEDRKVSSNRQTRQDAVDRIIAHKWLGIAIFAAVM